MIFHVYLATWYGFSCEFFFCRVQNCMFGWLLYVVMNIHGNLLSWHDFSYQVQMFAENSRLQRVSHVVLLVGSLWSQLSSFKAVRQKRRWWIFIRYDQHNDRLCCRKWAYVFYVWYPFFHQNSLYHNQECAVHQNDHRSLKIGYNSIYLTIGSDRVTSQLSPQPNKRQKRTERFRYNQVWSWTIWQHFVYGLHLHIFIMIISKEQIAA